MATERTVTIGYAGTLIAYAPATGKFSLSKVLRRAFSVFTYSNLDSSTRSGYYLFRGVAEFKKKHPEKATRLKIQLWGSIAEGNRQQVKELGIDDIVTIEGYFSKSESVARLSGCDVMFLPLESAKNGQRPLMIPGKLYELLSIGKPVLLLAEPSDCRDILERSGLGITCSPYDATQIAERLDEIVSDFDSVRQKYLPDADYIAQFSFRNLTGKLSGIFTRLMHTE